MVDRVALRRDPVSLEPLDLAHVTDLLQAATEDRSTYRYALVPGDRAAMETYVADALRDEAAGEALPFVVRHLRSGAVVGSTRLMDLAYWGSGHVPSVAEIGHTWLAPSVQRTAVNTTAKLLLLGHAFDGWGVHRVTLKTDARNGRSRAAIERIGARFEGVRRAHMLGADGAPRDTAYYSIVAAEWPAVRDLLLGRLSGG